MIDPNELAKWRLAHQNPNGQNIYVPEEGLATVAPFPSLYARDFITFLESKGTSPEVVRFVNDMQREMDWTYDNWAKAQRDADPSQLIGDMINNCTKEDAFYAPIRRFLTDYAQANGIPLKSDVASHPVWFGFVDGASETTVPTDASAAPGL